MTQADDPAPAGSGGAVVGARSAARGHARRATRARSSSTSPTLSVYYGSFRAVRNVTLADPSSNEITALIGPSGCGKTTVLRCLNRMNDLIEGARVEGQLHYHGVDLYDEAVDPVEVRRRIGMVFQKPNPFPKSIYDNIAFGPKIAG